MKYQELIDKYSNPNHHSRGSLNISYLTNTSNKLDPTSKSQYASELAQLERSNHQRNRSRSSKNYDLYDSKSFGNRQNSPRLTEEKTIVDTAKESIFKNLRVDTSATVPAQLSPQSKLKYEDLRKTTGTDFSIR